jgi:hypothetical protein
MSAPRCDIWDLYGQLVANGSNSYLASSSNPYSMGILVRLPPSWTVLRLSFLSQGDPGTGKSPYSPSGILQQAHRLQKLGELKVYFFVK